MPPVVSASEVRTHIALTWLSHTELALWWCRHQVMMRHPEHEFAMTNEAMLAEFMGRVSQVADVMDQNQPGQPEAAARLREAVEDLRDVCPA